MTANRNPIRLLLFMMRYPHQWHAIGYDSRRAIRSLAKLGLVEYDAVTRTARLIIGG